MKLTNFAENALADFIRGQTLTLPAAWHFSLCTTADDTGVTEATGTGIARVAVTRALANFSGTQGAGTTTASVGTSHTTYNNGIIQWPTAGAGGWSTSPHIGVFDASSGGNCWFYGDLGSPVTVANGGTFSLAISAAVFELGLTGGMSDYLANKLIDLIWRAQAFSWPATTYVRLITTAASNAVGGTEVSGGSYARVALASSLAAISGTQGAGTTVASTGTSGRVSNNAALTYPTPTANWGTVVGMETMDALTLGTGNRLWYAALGAPKTINNGALPAKFDANALGFTFA